MRRVLCLTLALVAAALVPACGRGAGDVASSPAREIRIAMVEQGSKMAFEPARVTVKPGERVRFVIENKGTMDHEFESDEAGIEEVVVPPGKSRTVEWTAPAKAGDYPFVCDMPGHVEAGMKGTIAVQP